MPAQYPYRECQQNTCFRWKRSCTAKVSVSNALCPRIWDLHAAAVHDWLVSSGPRTDRAHLQVCDNRAQGFWTAPGGLCVSADA